MGVCWERRVQLWGLQLRRPVGNLTPNGKKQNHRRRETAMSVRLVSVSASSCDWQPAEESKDARRGLSVGAGAWRVGGVADALTEGGTVTLG